MPDSFNSSIGIELASLRTLGAVRRQVSAKDRLVRERREAMLTNQKPPTTAMSPDNWGADD